LALPATCAPSDARERRRQTRDVAARAEDRAASLPVVRVVGADDVEIAQIRAAETEAGHSARGHLEPPVGPAIWLIALHGTPLVEGDPDPPLGIDREAVGVAVDTDRCLGCRVAGRVELVHKHAGLRRVAVVDRPAVGRETDAVRERDSAVERRPLFGRVDPPALAGDALTLELERVGLHGARVDTAL